VLQANLATGRAGKLSTNAYRSPPASPKAFHDAGGNKANRPWPRGELQRVAPPNLDDTEIHEKDAAWSAAARKLGEGAPE